MKSPIVTFTSKREAEKLAKKIGGEVVELMDADFVVSAVSTSLLDSYADGWAKGYEQGKSENGEHA